MKFRSLPCPHRPQVVVLDAPAQRSAAWLPRFVQGRVGHDLNLCYAPHHRDLNAVAWHKVVLCRKHGPCLLSACGALVPGRFGGFARHQRGWDVEFMCGLGGPFDALEKKDGGRHTGIGRSECPCKHTCCFLRLSCPALPALLVL